MNVATSAASAATATKAGPPLPPMKIDRTILQSIDDGISNLHHRPWKAVLPFHVYQCFPHEKVLLVGSNGNAIVECNLFERTGGMYKGMIARVNPSVYPVVPGGWVTNKETWERLCSVLIELSRRRGNCGLTCNGSYGSTGQRALFCSNHRHYRKGNVTAGGEYRKFSFNRDRNNARKDDGKNQKKVTRTARPMKESDESTCKAKLLFGIDDSSIFICCGIGYDTHEGHPPLDTGEMAQRKRTVPD